MTGLLVVLGIGLVVLGETIFDSDGMRFGGVAIALLGVLAA